MTMIDDSLTTIDYSIIGTAAALRALVEQGQSDAQIGAMARCSSETVRRWRAVFEIKRKPKSIHTPAPLRTWLTRAQFRKAAKKAYARHGRRWPEGYDPAEDVSYDPFWLD